MMKEFASKSGNDSVFPNKIVTDIEAAYRRELRQLSDIGFIFLCAAEGDIRAAETLFDDLIALLFEGGALSLWRYRIVLERIHEGP